MKKDNERAIQLRLDDEFFCSFCTDTRRALSNLKKGIFNSKLKIFGKKRFLFGFLVSLRRTTT